MRVASRFASRRRDERQFDEAYLAAGVIDALHGLPVILRLGPETTCSCRVTRWWCRSSQPGFRSMTAIVAPSELPSRRLPYGARVPQPDNHPRPNQRVAV